MNRKYGWVRDLADRRDFTYMPRMVKRYPSSASLKDKQPPIWDQGQLASCTGFGCKRVAMYGMFKVKQRLDISALFIYWCERALENTTGSDGGAMIRDGIKALAQWGVCEEKLWPYRIGRYAMQPPDKAFKNALRFQALQYERVNNATPDQIKNAILSDLPVVFGMSIYESFETAAVAKTGIVPMPSGAEKMLGGHAMCIVGYDDCVSGCGIGCFQVANSWGTSWGKKGYCYIPYDYLCSAQASDFWAITKME